MITSKYAREMVDACVNVYKMTIYDGFNDVRCMIHVGYTTYFKRN